MKLFKNCVSSVTFRPHPNAGSADENIGPLVGQIYASNSDEIIIENCGGVLNANGNVRSTGLIGRLYIPNESAKVTIQNIYSEIDYTNATAQGAGGIIGLIDGFYTTPPVSISKGWSAIRGSVSSDVRNVVGRNEAATVTITDFYADGRYTDVSPINGVTYLPTDKIYKREGYPALDFDTIWMIEEGADYPRFVFSSNEVLDYLLWLFHTPNPTPVNEENRITEFRAGKVMNYRVYDVSEGMENAKDITTSSKIEFVPMADSEVDPTEQVEIDDSIKYLKVNDAGELVAKVTHKEKYTRNTFEVYGPDNFSLSESFTETFVKNVPRKGQITAHYRDDYKEVLAPLPDFVTPINDMFVINEASIKPLEVGTHQIEVKRFRTKERFDITVEPLSKPEVVDVINTAATLYVFFRLDAKLDVDTYFAVRAFSDEAKTIELNSKTTVANVEDFTITIDGAGSWQPIPQSALSPSGEDSEMYCCRIYAGPLDKVYLDLGIATGEETEDIYAPLISATPPPGIYNMPVAVKFTLNEPGDIFFTYEDGIPDIPYQEGESIVLTKTNTLKVRAVDEKGNVSRIVSYKYVIDAVAPTVGANPPPAPYMEPINIELTVDELEATIYYTTDGSEPDINSSVYSMPILLEDGAITIKAFAIDSAGNVGEVVTLEYEVVANPKGGSFEDPIILNQPVGTVNINYAFNQFPEVYQRFDDFVVEATYKATIVDIPEGGDGSLVLFDGNKEYIASGWVKQPLTFTATTQTMYIMIAMSNARFDPVKTLIELE